MKYANEYAPNLFCCFADWYDNFTDDLGIEPSPELKENAREYFERM